MAPSRGGSAENPYSARHPSRVTCHGKRAAAIPDCTPSAQRLASGIMDANASAVSTEESVAAIATIDRPLPASVPPMPPTSMSSSSTTFSTLAATSALKPKVPQGIPPPIDLPITSMSGVSPAAPV